jgi:hypothetical protein
VLLGLPPSRAALLDVSAAVALPADQRSVATPGSRAQVGAVAVLVAWSQAAAGWTDDVGQGHAFQARRARRILCPPTGHPERGIGRPAGRHPRQDGQRERQEHDASPHDPRLAVEQGEVKRRAARRQLGGAGQVHALYAARVALPRYDATARRAAEA